MFAEVAAEPVGSVGDDELMASTSALEHARRLLDSAVLTRLAELDRRGSTDLARGQRTAAWYAQEAKLPRGVAAARLRTAWAVGGDLAPVGEALREGRIGFDHARVVADAANPRNLDDLAALTAELCDAAELCTFERWSSEVRGLADQLDPDGGHDPGDDPERNRLRASRIGSVTAIDGQLVGEAALISTTALDQVADELYRRYQADAANCADAKVPRRTQLLAEAFVEICRRAMSVELDGSRPPCVEATVVLNAAEPDVVTDDAGVVLDDMGTLLCDAVLHQPRPGPRGQPARRWMCVPRLWVPGVVERRPSRRPLGRGPGERMATPTRTGCAACVATTIASPTGQGGSSTSPRTAGRCGARRAASGSGDNDTSASVPGPFPTADVGFVGHPTGPRRVTWSF